MTPSIGRIVIYRQSKAAAVDDDRLHPAIITHVHSDTCVNLTVFLDQRPPWPCPSSMRADQMLDDDGAAWMWPERAPA